MNPSSEIPSKQKGSCSGLDFLAAEFSQTLPHPPSLGRIQRAFSSEFDEIPSPNNNNSSSLQGSTSRDRLYSSSFSPYGNGASPSPFLAKVKRGIREETPCAISNHPLPLREETGVEDFINFFNAKTSKKLTSESEQTDIFEGLEQLLEFLALNEFSLAIEITPLAEKLRDSLHEKLNHSKLMNPEELKGSLEQLVSTLSAHRC